MTEEIITLNQAEIERVSVGTKNDKPSRCAVTDELNVHILNNNNDSRLDHWWKSLSLKQQWAIFKREN